VPFTPPDDVALELLPDGRVRLVTGLRWTGSRHDTVDVAAGTVSDGATRPWFTAAIVDKWGAATRAFLVHDELCDRLRWHRELVARWQQAMAEHRAGVLACKFVGEPPAPPAPLAFDAVDSDGALRAVLRELGMPAPMRWIYWTGVRWGALGSRYRWAGWWRTLPALLAMTPLALLVLLPAVLGALLSSALLAVVELLAWPFTRRRPSPLRRAPRRLQRPTPVADWIRADLRAAVLADVDEQILGTPEQRADPQPLQGLLSPREHLVQLGVQHAEHAKRTERELAGLQREPLPEHDFAMPHHLGGLDGFAEEGWPPPRPPMDAHGCPPNCPRRLAREARS